MDRHDKHLERQGGYTEGNVKVEVDFGYTADQKPVLTGTDLWSDIVNSTPLDDIQLWVDQWRAKGIRLRRAMTSQNSAAPQPVDPETLSR